MIEFPVMRSHENPKRAKYELWRAVTDLKSRNFEVTQPMQMLQRGESDVYYKNKHNIDRVPGCEYQTYFVKMRSVES